jgi:exopolysaccharide production protein ExoQ
MYKLFLLSEKIFTIVASIHYLGSPLIVILSGGISEGEEGDAVSFIIINQLFSLIYLVTFILLILRWKQVLPYILNNGLIWLFFCLAISSMFWTYSPELTKIRLVALLGTMMFSLYLASRYSLTEQLRLLGWVFGLITVTSIIFAVLIPKFGVMSGSHLGAWRGIYTHKNVFGKIMVLSVIVFYIRLCMSQKHRWIYWAFLGISIMLTILSRSSSPLINLVILLAIISIIPIFRWNYLVMIPVLIGILAVGILFYLLLVVNAEQATSIFGKDLTFSGRTNLWLLMLDKVWENPWLGYGFGGFWNGFDGPSAYVWNASAFKAPNGHNGYLDLCLELGLVGVSIYSINFINSFKVALSYIRTSGTAEAFWPTILLCYIILSNLTESSLVLQNNFSWILQLTIFLSLSIPQPSRVANLAME